MVAVIEFSDRRVRYEITNPLGQAEFFYDFPVSVDIDGNVGISVYVDDELQADYTVSVPDNKITLDTVAPQGAIVVLDGDTLPQRDLNYPLRGGLPSARLNEDANKIYYMIQELLRDRSRSLVLPPSAPDDVSGTAPAPQAGRAIIWNATGKGLENGPDADEISNAQGYASAAATSASSASGFAASAAASAIAAQAAAVGMKYREARAGSTANVSVSSAPSSIDGVTLSVNDRVLLKNQSAPAENGLYQFNGAAAALTRTTDMDSWVEVPGTVVVVTEGTVNADKVFLCTSNAGGTLGTTAINFVDWAAAILDGTMTNAKLANMAEATFKMRAAGSGTGAPIDGTAAQATAALNAMVGDSGSGGTKGLVPAPAAGDAWKSFRGNGTFDSSLSGVAEVALSGTTTNLSTAIPAGVNKITINLNAISTNGTSGVLIQLGSSSFTTSGYTSRSAYLYAGSNSQGSSSAGFIIGTGSSSASYTGVMTISRAPGTNTWIAAFSAADSGQNGAGSGGGIIALSGVLDRIRAATVNGTDIFDAGAISCFFG